MNISGVRPNVTFYYGKAKSTVMQFSEDMKYLNGRLGDLPIIADLSISAQRQEPISKQIESAVVVLRNYRDSLGEVYEDFTHMLKIAQEAIISLEDDIENPPLGVEEDRINSLIVTKSKAEEYEASLQGYTNAVENQFQLAKNSVAAFEKSRTKPSVIALDSVIRVLITKDAEIRQVIGGVAS